MKIHAQSTPLRAMTLIEVMVYIVIFVVVMGFAFATFYSYWDATDHFGRDATDIARVLHVGERWRQDIRASSGPVEAVDRDGAQTLRIPTRAGPIVYVFANFEVRREAPGSGPGPVLPRIKSSHMLSETRGGVAVWRWELELIARKDKLDLHPLFSFAAAAQGGTSP